MAAAPRRARVSRPRAAVRSAKDSAKDKAESRKGLRSRGVAALMRALGHDFARPELLTEALTHRGAVDAEAAARFGNERLEFLGDRVLGLVIAEWVHEQFPSEPEGVLARRLTGLVRREALEAVAANLDLGRFLILAPSDVQAGARANRGLQADACEAVIGALYLDGGLAAAKAFILARWRDLIEAHGGGARDAKTQLQEWAQARGLPLPKYRELSRSGPAHAPEFVMAASLPGFDAAEGRAPSKRAAEQAAAAALLETLSHAEPGGDPS